MAAPQPVDASARGLGPFIVKTQDLEKLAELGRGSFGVVHAGKLKIAAKTIRVLSDPALYVIDREHPEYKKMIADFFAEASMLVSLRHVNVIRVYGVGMDAEGIPWMLLELGDMPLDVYLAREKAGGITENELAVMWFEIACGLLYLHGHKPLPIIHRDIKPDNVMVVITNGSVTYKLNDVGLARVTDASGILVKNYGGCIQYAAPEVPTGIGFTGTADVYSLGVSVAELVQKFLNVPGRARRSVFEVDRDWANVVPKGIAWLRAVSAPLADLLASCCEADPSVRITSARLVTSLTAMYPALLAPLLPAPDDATVAFTELEKRLAEEKARADAEAAAKIHTEGQLLEAREEAESLRRQLAALQAKGSPTKPTGSPPPTVPFLDKPKFISFASGQTPAISKSGAGGSTALAHTPVPASAVPASGSVKPEVFPVRARSRSPAQAVSGGGAGGTGAHPPPPPAAASAGIEGTFVRSLAIRTENGNNGLAISPDGTQLVVSNDHTHKIAVYSLPDGVFLEEFGGEGNAPGQFKHPRKICFSPRNPRNVFIADCNNNRLQEMTLDGVHVKMIGAGVIDGNVYGVTARARSDYSDVIAGCTFGKIFLFYMTSGGDIQVRSVGKPGSAPGDLNGCYGLRIMPDGGHILISESYNNRLSLFTLPDGSGGPRPDHLFKRCIGVGVIQGAYDVEFAPNGDMLIADWKHHRVSVFHSDGSAPIRSFGSEGVTDGKFKIAVALAMHAGQLYVLDNDSARVQVFK